MLGRPSFTADQAVARNGEDNFGSMVPATRITTAFTGAQPHAVPTISQDLRCWLLLRGRGRVATAANGGEAHQHEQTAPRERKPADPKGTAMVVTQTARKSRHAANDGQHIRITIGQVFSLSRGRQSSRDRRCYSNRPNPAHTDLLQPEHLRIRHPDRGPTAIPIRPFDQRFVPGRSGQAPGLETPHLPGGCAARRSSSSRPEILANLWDV